MPNGLSKSKATSLVIDPAFCPFTEGDPPPITALGLDAPGNQGAPSLPLLLCFSSLFSFSPKKYTCVNWVVYVTQSSLSWGIHASRQDSPILWLHVPVLDNAISTPRENWILPARAMHPMPSLGRSRIQSSTS